VTRVLVVRGHLVNPWELRPWALLPDRFDVAALVTGSNVFDTSDVPLPKINVRARRDLLPRGRLGDVAMGLVGDRYRDADDDLARTDIVHAAELSFWFAGEAARLKSRHRYKLVLTVWETIPFLATFRNRFARRYRAQTLAETDLFLPATERARQALLLEGVEPERIEVCPPGIDLERFSRAASPASPYDEHLVISPGRFVWEKGHQDVLRALAAIHRGLIKAPEGARARLLLVGQGPEEQRLRSYASELGIAEAVEFCSVPYEEMPSLYTRASCMVLASLATGSGGFYLGDNPRFFWEEQFGLVLAESMAAGIPIVASQSGAIPEVAGEAASYFLPGDWMGLAARLVEGPLAHPPGERVQHPPELIRRYSTVAAAERLAAAYDRVLASLLTVRGPTDGPSP
jgi:glycosyltransferase involved in cell wall biosynthesis